MAINAGRDGPEKLFTSGSFCEVVLAVDHRGSSPCDKEFFSSRAVGSQAKTRLDAYLRYVARYGFPLNEDRYRFLFHEIHYLKIRGYRALAIDRYIGRPQLIVCSVVEKKRARALSDADFDRARRIFASHCERFPHDRTADSPPRRQLRPRR